MGLLRKAVARTREALAEAMSTTLGTVTYLDVRDSYENWLTDLLDNCIGKPALAKVSVAFEEMDGRDVCRVGVRPGRQPVYAQGKQTTDSYVRLNNGTRSLDTQEAVDYILAHDWARR